MKKILKPCVSRDLITPVYGVIDAKSDGNSGYGVGTFTLRFLGAENDTIVDVGKYTEILERNEEGKWISTYGIWSSNEPIPTE